MVPSQLHLHTPANLLQILILGLGWTGQFLVELLESQHLPFAATTRDGRNGTIQWTLPQGSSCSSIDVAPLPAASTILVTFPVLQSSCMKALIEAHESKHGQTQWILLSSTRPFNGTPSDRHGPMDPSKDTSGRMAAETVILEHGGTVLHLAGLWGLQRWVLAQMMRQISDVRCMI